MNPPFILHIKVSTVVLGSEHMKDNKRSKKAPEGAVRDAELASVESEDDEFGEDVV